MMTPAKYVQLRTEYIGTLHLVATTTQHYLAALDDGETTQPPDYWLRLMRNAREELRHISDRIDVATRHEMLYSLGQPGYTLVPNAISPGIMAAYRDENNLRDAIQAQHNTLLAEARRYRSATVYPTHKRPDGEAIAGFHQVYAISGHSGHGGTANYLPPGIE